MEKAVNKKYAIQRELKHIGKETKWEVRLLRLGFKFSSMLFIKDNLKTKQEG